jgi:Leucine-rich repeat (LRR) protein
MVKSLKSPKGIILAKNKISVLSPLILVDFVKYPAIQDHLREINLSKNYIKIIPDEFLLLVNLSLLRLDHNQIEVIPQRFADSFYNMTELWLNNNHITEIPWNFNRMRRLRIIHLNHNKISYIPNTFGELVLEELSLHNNPLSEDLFISNTIEGILEAIITQKIPKQYREQVQQLIVEWEFDDKGKSEAECQFLYFLQQKEFRTPFREYMNKEFSQENLDFWLRIDQFKWRYNSSFEIRAPDLIKEAGDIYKSFIAENSPHSINVPSQVSDKIKKYIRRLL